jgi:anti-sigma28 factor (negative regulator of flagellin synthesis)
MITEVAMRIDSKKAGPAGPMDPDPRAPRAAPARLAAIRASILLGTYVVDLDRLAERIVDAELAR